MTDAPKKRPSEPTGGDDVWYVGWECSWSDMTYDYTKEGWVAYRGGADLGAPTVTSSTWEGLLDAIDSENEA